MAIVKFEEMKAVIKQAFLKAGLSDEQAETCAHIHTSSSCDGVYSHGLNRVPRFVNYVKEGWINLKDKPQELRSMGCIKVFDAKQGIGIINSLFATDCAIELAKQYGVGIVGLRNSTHWMRGGTYGWHAAEQGYAFIGWTNTESCMPAWGAKDNHVGNNPYVMAIPGKEAPLVLDMAMSQFSYGKLQVTRLKGEQLPFPGGYDKEGNLTSDPGKIEESMRILPTGYWKGSGFAILLDAMAAMLTQGNPTCEIDKIQKGSCTGASQVFIVFDPKHLGGDDYCKRVSQLVEDYVNASTPNEQTRVVTFPGQRTLSTRKKQLAEGILADDSVWAEVKALAGL